MVVPRHEVLDKVFSSGEDWYEFDVDTLEEFSFGSGVFEKSDYNEIMHAAHPDKPEEWSVLEHDPTLGDRLYSRYLMGEGEGYIVKVEAVIEMGEDLEDYAYNRIGITPKDHYSEIIEVLDSYNFHIEEFDDNGNSVVTNYNPEASNDDERVMIHEL